MAKALDVVGERWTLLVVRNLLVGGQRYKDLLESLPGITTNLLAERLRELTQAGLVTQRELPAPGRAVVYELTPEGRQLEPVVMALGRFGARYLARPAKGDRTHVRWAMVSLKRRYQGCKRPWVLALDIDGEHAFRMRLGGEALDIDVGGPQHGDDASVSMTTQALRGLLFEGAPARALVDSGTVEVRGEPSAFFALVRAVGGVVERPVA